MGRWMACLPKWLSTIAVLLCLVAAQVVEMSLSYSLSPPQQSGVSSKGSPVPKASWVIRKKTAEGTMGFDRLESENIFNGRRVVLFALPGAFTPTCSDKQLPEYEKLHDKFAKFNIQDVYCLSVNDPFVMNAWKKNLSVEKVVMLPDGVGDFTKKMGFLVDKSNFGLGWRSWRYAMIVDNGMIEEMFIEEGKRDNAEDDPFEVSRATNVLQFLEKQQNAE